MYTWRAGQSTLHLKMLIAQRFAVILVLVTYFARKKSCWTDCVAPDEKPIKVIGTSYNGTIDRHCNDRKRAKEGVEGFDESEKGKRLALHVSIHRPGFR